MFTPSTTYWLSRPLPPDDRRVGDADGAAAADARREVERVAEAAADRQARQRLAVELGADGGARRVHRRWRRDDLEPFPASDPTLHRQRQIDPLPEADLDVGPIDGAEALQLRVHRVRSRRQEGDREAAVRVADRRLRSLRARHRHRDAGQRQALRVHRPSGERPAGVLCRRGARDDTSQEMRALSRPIDSA